jgi:hypothetical protein
MSESVLKSSLPEPFQRLIDRIREVQYGRIENLVVRQGVPVFTSETRTVQDILIGVSKDKPVIPPDYALKSKDLALLERIKRLDSGTVHELEIKGGLPFRMLIMKGTAA